MTIQARKKNVQNNENRTKSHIFRIRAKLWVSLAVEFHAITEEHNFKIHHTITKSTEYPMRSWNTKLGYHSRCVKYCTLFFSIPGQIIALKI